MFYHLDRNPIAFPNQVTLSLPSLLANGNPRDHQRTITTYPRHGLTIQHNHFTPNLRLASTTHRTSLCSLKALYVPELWQRVQIISPFLIVLPTRPNDLATTIDRDRFHRAFSYEKASHTAYREGSSMDGQVLKATLSHGWKLQVSVLAIAQAYCDAATRSWLILSMVIV